MTKSKIDVYLEGWRLGDPERSVAATVEGFYYIDPNTGKILRHEFVEFMEAFKRDAAELCGGVVPTPFLNYSDVVMHEENGVTTVWCWWCVTGTDFQGSALIKAASEGILSEQIAYFTRLP